MLKWVWYIGLRNNENSTHGTKIFDFGVKSRFLVDSETADCLKEK